MSQLLLCAGPRRDAKQLGVLCELENIHEEGAIAYVDNVHSQDNPYRYGTLEYEAWAEGWSYARASAEIDEECARA